MGPKTRSPLEDYLALQIRAAGLPAPERERIFSPPRRFRFDFSWLEHMVALEIQGSGAGGYGRHQRPLGFERDCEKFCLAAIQGWRVLLVTGKMVRSGEALKLLELALGPREE